MDPRIETFLANADRFDQVARAASAWDAASPCEDWTAADVLDHVVETQRDFLLKRGADLPPLPSGVSPGQRWAAHLAGVRDLVADDAFTTEEYDGYFGRTSVAATLRDFYGFDMLVHRWDLGRAVGTEVSWTDAEMDALERNLDALGDNLYQDTVCKPALDVADDAPRQERLLARMGRRA